MWHLLAQAVFCSISGPSLLLSHKRPNVRFTAAFLSSSTSFGTSFLQGCSHTKMIEWDIQERTIISSTLNTFCRCTYMLPKADYKSVRPLVIPLLNSVVSEWMYSESLYLHNKQKWLFFSPWLSQLGVSESVRWLFNDFQVQQKAINSLVSDRRWIFHLRPIAEGSVKNRTIGKKISADTEGIWYFQPFLMETICFFYNQTITFWNLAGLFVSAFCKENFKHVGFKYLTDSLNKSPIYRWKWVVFD